jgi:protein phosphatase
MTIPAFPLHNLIFCNDFIPFDPHECVDMHAVAADLTGRARRPELATIVFNELKHRVLLKLSLGERVVISPGQLSLLQQTQLDLAARNQGAFVHRLDTCAFGAIQRTPKPESYRPQWQGITVIGDVHGDSEVLQQALDWGVARQHFIWFLGDVIDHGSRSLEAMVLVHDAVMQGGAGMILANHERKIARWLSQDGRHPLRLSAGNKVTTTAYERLSGPARSIWAGQFRALLARSSLIEQIDTFTLAHAAVHPSYWTAPDDQAIERYALYGEGDQMSGNYQRTHRWTDHIPAGQTVIVGHTKLAPLPMMITGKLGGHAVFLDTGSGKGGCLSSADLRYSASGLHLECFKKY